jgi:hypothetical protein
MSMDREGTEAQLHRSYGDCVEEGDGGGYSVVKTVSYSVVKTVAFWV